jgi:hypothetical protein
MPAPEILPAKLDRRIEFSFLGVLVCLFATVAILTWLGARFWTNSPSGVWQTVGLMLVFAAGLILVSFYMPMKASLTALDEGLIVRISPRSPGVAVRWDAMAVRGRKAYLYGRQWGPPLVVSLTEYQRDRIAEWMKVRTPEPSGRGPAPEEIRLKLVTFR